MPKKKVPPKKVDSISHKDKRTNIPTEELRDFVEEHERTPEIMLYPRDPSLDPQLASMAEKEGLKGKVQMIYIDPPYGIKFGSNWQVSTRKRDVKDGKAEDATREPEQIRAFRDTWKLGVHSYLAYLRDRLVVARDLLTETGSVFVQIGDENIHLVRNVMDEVFGAENFEALITFRKTNITFATGRLGGVCDYVLWYAKDSTMKKYRQLFVEKVLGGIGSSNYGFVDLPSGVRRRMTSEEKDGAEPLEKGARVFSTENLMSSGATTSCIYDQDFAGKRYSPVRGKSWKTHREGLQRLIAADRCIALGDNRLYFITYFDEYPITKLTNAWYDTRGEMDLTYVVQTSTEIISRCLLMTTDPGDLVFDPTCGGGTTAVVSEQWGRRWITCDTSRVALALARTRIMTARFSYYLLADSPEGLKKETELTGIKPPTYDTAGDIRKGFVFKRVPHVTLGAIANNPEIKEGMTREQVETTIARNADSELLYDQPMIDNKIVRVCGPFSVESLSPHRVLSTADDDMNGTVSEQEAQKQQDFVTTIIENMAKAGVQNTRRKERLKFDRLEPYAGKWIQAAGEYTDDSGMVQRIALSIGPEHGTVGPQQVKEAAKEAVQGVGFDMLIVGGFAFDPHVAEEVKRYGKLTVLPAKMNPDLAMSDELLKKTGAANLFMVFGEPDVEMKKKKDGQIVVTIKGVDVYDPTTGVVRSSSTDDIACWFIDTDYNGESFFVRHAYFTGGDEPYNKLKRALRADIDEEAWDSLYSTISRPFPQPESGKIAVKVINHYGDEVIQVYEV